MSSTRASKKAKGSGTKRAPSAYLLFCNERRSEVREANPEMSMIEITKTLAAQWNDLPASEKEVSL
jgi:hypothetical protein